LLAGTIKGMTGSYELGLWFFAGVGVCAWGTVIVALRSKATLTPESSL